MKKIIAVGGSNSKKSINKQFAHYAATLVKDAEVENWDLNDFNIPLYGIDLEESNGIPSNVIEMTKAIQDSDGIIISLAEHNGAYSAAFKSIFDWISRVEGKVFETTPVLLLATSPGGRGGQSVLDIALDRFPRHGAKIAEHMSLPSFYDNFKEGKLINEEVQSELLKKVMAFQQAI